MNNAIHWESRKIIFKSNEYSVRHMIGFHYIGSQSGVLMSEVPRLGKAETFRVSYKKRQRFFDRVDKPYDFDTLEEATTRIKYLEDNHKYLK